MVYMFQGRSATICLLPYLGGDTHGVCHSVHVDVGAGPLRKNLLLMFIDSFDQVCSSGIVALNLRVVTLRRINDIFTEIACQIS